MTSEEEPTSESVPPSDNNPPIIGRGEDGSIMIVTGKRAASFVDGQWHPGILFEKHQIDEFRQVRKKEAVQALLEQAQDALNKSLDK